MSKMETKNLRIITPDEVVEKNNPLIKGITKVSEKVSEIDQPWPVEGTFNPDARRRQEDTGEQKERGIKM